MHRSIRWLDRCIEAHARPEEQNLFAIIQGGLDLELRRQCVDAMVERNTPGYAIGGLSGGEEKSSFWCVLLCDMNKRYRGLQPAHLSYTTSVKPLLAGVL